MWDGKHDIFFPIKFFKFLGWPELKTGNTHRDLTSPRKFRDVFDEETLLLHPIFVTKEKTVCATYESLVPSVWFSLLMVFVFISLFVFLWEINPCVPVLGKAALTRAPQVDF